MCMGSRTVWRAVGLVTQSVLYVAGGINHFWHSRFYTAIMPPHYDHPLALVQISGVAEVLGGLGLLVPATRRVSAWGLIAMLLVYYDVHIYMVRHPERFSAVPEWALWVRLPLQLVLLYWAYIYTRPDAGKPAFKS